ncbi:MAG: hypothetical protein V7745_00875 [Pseudomonadales bacterium]
MAEKGSFWLSVPGILTGVAAIITAVGGLLIALAQLGYIGKNDVTSNPTPPAIETVERTKASSQQQPPTTPVLPPVSPNITLFSGTYIGTSTEGYNQTAVQLVLKRQDSAVTGTYVQDGVLGDISGTVSGNTLSYEWRSGEYFGRGVTVDQGGSIQGTWGYGYSYDDGGVTMAKLQ